MLAKGDLLKRLEPFGGLQNRVVIHPGEKRRGFRTPDGKAMVYKTSTKEYELTPQALAMAAGLAGIPEAYAKKTPKDLLVPHLNYWFAHMGQARWVTKDNAALAVVKPQVIPVDPTRAVDLLDKAVGPVEFDRCYANDKAIQIYSVGHEQKAVAKGDIVRGGVFIQVSPFGAVNPEVKGYVHRLICTNGAVRVSDTSRFSYGGDDGESFEAWYREATKAAYNSLDDEVKHYQQMAGARVQGNISRVLESIYAQHRVPHRLRDTITARILDQGASTLYDIFNHFTAVASHDVEDGDLVLRLMESAGDMAAHNARCPACHRVVN